MLKNHQSSQIKDVIIALRKQVTADPKIQYRDVSDWIRYYCDFGWTATSPAIKELLGCSISDFLKEYDFILNTLGLQLINCDCNVLNRWTGLKGKTFNLIIPSYDHTVEEALNDGHLETHQSLLNLLIKAS